MWRFIREHPGASIGIAVGGLINVGSRVNDVYSLFNAGLPAAAWEAIGANIFFVAVVVLFYQWHKSAAASRDAQSQQAAGISSPVSASPEFFPDQPALQIGSGGSLAARFANVTSASAIFVVGSKFYHAQNNVGVIKRLLLPNPEGEAIKYHAQTVKHPLTTKLIREATREAIKAGAKVRWYDHFFFNSIILADTDKPTGWMHIETVLPYSQPEKRPSYIVSKQLAPQAVAELQRVFDEIWDNAKDAPNR